MRELYKLKGMLVNELEEYGKRGDMSKTSLDAVNKLAHAAKNVYKVIRYCEEDGDNLSTAYSKADSEHLKEELRKMIESL